MLYTLPFIVTVLTLDCRFITVCQVLIFSTTCIARAAQNLSVTTFELTTFGFVFVMLGTSLCWWRKPMDIGRPIILKTDTTIAEILHEVSKSIIFRKHTDTNSSPGWSCRKRCLRTHTFGFCKPPRVVHWYLLRIFYGAPREVTYSYLYAEDQSPTNRSHTDRQFSTAVSGRPIFLLLRLCLLSESGARVI
jgi:hypothetical protein